MKNFIIQKTKLIDADFISIGKSYLSGLLGALTVFFIAHFYEVKPYTVATVNITGIVDQFIKQEAKNNLPPGVLKKEVEVFGGALEKELKSFSNSRHLILLPSEAVIAGSKDYTAAIRARMSKKIQHRPALYVD